MKRSRRRYRQSVTVIAVSLTCGYGLPAGSQSAVDAEPIKPEAVDEVAACAVCHGPNGEGNTRLGAPRIGGLDEWYISRQLENFRKGIRGGTDEDAHGTQMHAIALALDDMSVIDDLARYYSMLNPEEAEPTLQGNADNGEELYTVCAACHGQDGTGSEQLNTPTMVGQYDWYIVRQLEHFKSGLRGGDQRDTFGAQMAPIMQTIEGEQDLIDLAAYISTL